MSVSLWTVPHAPATPFCVKKVAIPPVIRPPLLPSLLPPLLPLDVDLGLEEVVVDVWEELDFGSGDTTFGLVFGVGVDLLDGEELDSDSCALGTPPFGVDPDFLVAVGVMLGWSLQSPPFEPGSRVDVGYAALAEDNAPALGVHWGGRLSLRFSVANKGWQH